MNKPPVMEDITPPTEKPVLLRPAFDSLIGVLADNAEARYTAREKGLPFGAKTGFPILDSKIGGALEAGLHIIHGSSGVGKTAFALQVGSSCGCPCLYVTCEMTPLELLRRHAARVTNGELSSFKNGTYDGNEARWRAVKAAEEAPYFAILDATENAATREDVLKAAELTKELHPSQHFLLIVDSLHTWADMVAGEGVPEYERLNTGLTDLRLLSKRLDCPVIAIAERNRASMKSSDQNSGAGTRKIEYGAETVIGLDKDTEGIQMGAGTPVTASISKNRSGSTTKALFHFFGANQKYVEVSKLR